MLESALTKPQRAPAPEAAPAEGANGGGSHRLEMAVAASDVDDEELFGGDQKP